MDPRPNPSAIHALFEMSLAAEARGRDFYHLMSQAFAHLPEVEEFWLSLVRDEGGHIAVLNRIRAGLNQAQLDEPVQPEVLARNRTILDILTDDRIASVATLDDAYELAHEFEHSELNRLFTFLATRYITQAERSAFVIHELLDHQAKLVDFGKCFGDRAWRREVAAYGDGPAQRIA
jgi:hypothetical protein